MPAEVENCPKGLGKVKFKEDGTCPVSGVKLCKDCDYPEKPGRVKIGKIARA